MLLPSLTSPSAPISGWLCFPSRSSLPPGAPNFEGSGHPGRDAEVPGHRGVSAAGARDIASALSNQLLAWVGEAGGSWGAMTWDKAGSQRGVALGCWRAVARRGACCGKWPSAHLVRGSARGLRDKCVRGWHRLPYCHIRGHSYEETSTKELHG